MGISITVAAERRNHLQQTSSGQFSLPTVVKLATGDVQDLLGPNIAVHFGSVPGVEVTAELRRILASWFGFLGSQAGAAPGVIYVSVARRKRCLDIQLRLFETQSLQGRGSPEFSQGAAEPGIAELEALLALGGEFRINCRYPETSVWLKVPLDSIAG